MGYARASRAWSPAGWLILGLLLAAATSYALLRPGGEIGWPETTAPGLPPQAGPATCVAPGALAGQPSPWSLPLPARRGCDDVSQLGGPWITEC